MPQERAGAANRRRPCTPALANKIAAARFLSLSLAATGSGARERPCKMRPRRASMRVAPASGERFGDFDATNTRAVFL
ncbi:hypothetical protein ECZU24_50430 [Escherichia coli]|nr:hypothetical protein ECZU24_50430 [Escherichia coli]